MQQEIVDTIRSVRLECIENQYDDVIVRKIHTYLLGVCINTKTLYEIIYREADYTPKNEIKPAFAMGIQSFLAWYEYSKPYRLGKEIKRSFSEIDLYDESNWLRKGFKKREDLIL